MFKLNLESEVYPVIECMFSGCLPHENFDSTLYSSILVTINNYVKLDEMSLEYYCMFEWLRELKSIASVTDGKPTATKDIFAMSIETNLDLLTQNYNVGLKEYLDENGIPFSLKIDTEYEEGCNILYNRCLDLYDRLFKMKVSSQEALSYESNLKDTLLSYATKYIMEKQVLILNGYITYKKHRYIGSSGAFDFATLAYSELRDRMDIKSAKVVTVDNLEESNERRNKYKETRQVLMKYDVPTFDDVTPVVKPSLDIYVAPPGTCKTTLFCDMAAQAALQGLRVLYISGETSIVEVENFVLASYIWKKRHIGVKTAHCLGIEECDEAIKRVINIERANLCEDGVLSIRPALHYETAYDELKSMYEALKFDIVFIDHSLAMIGNQLPTEKIDMLAMATRQFKQDYGVNVSIASHPSPEASKDLKDEVVPSIEPTKFGKSLTAEADIVMVLATNSRLRKISSVWANYHKRRRGGIIPNHAILTFDFQCCIKEYKEEYQVASGEMSASAESAIANLVDAYDEDELDEEYDYED